MKYEKINTLFKRDKDNKFVIIPGNYSKDEFANVKFYETSEKIDGFNTRIIISKNEFVNKIDLEFAGRTDKAIIPKITLEVLKNMFTLEKLLEVFDTEKFDTKIVLYGESYGPKIQRGGKYRDDQSFILFDIMIDGFWMLSDFVTDCAEKLKIERVPILGILTIDDIVDLVKMRPLSIIGKEDTIIEGVVCRSHPLMLDRTGKRIIFKLKVCDYDQLERLLDEKP